MTPDTRGGLPIPPQDGFEYSSTPILTKAATRFVEHLNPNFHEVDTVEYDREIDGLQFLIDQANERLKEAAHNRSLLPSTTVDWSNLRSSYLAAAKVARDVIAEDEKRSTDKNRPYIQEYLFRGLVGIAGYKVYEQHQRMKRFAQHHNFYADIEKDIEFLDFGSIGEITAPLRGTPIVDIINPSVTRDMPTNKIFHSFMEAMLLRRHQFTYEESASASENSSNNLYSQFPQVSKRFVIESAGVVLGLINLSKTYVESVEKVFKGNFYHPLAKQLVIAIDNMQRIKGKIAQGILDPNSKDHKEMLDACMEYMNNKREYQISLLFVAGVRDADSVLSFYRHAAKNQQSGIEPDFYNWLTNSIRTLVEEGALRETLIIPTIDDIDSIAPNGTENHNSTTLLDTKPMIVDISQKTREKEFDVEPTSIVWEHIVEPKSVVFKIDNSPQRFKVLFSWGNNLGENTDVEVDVDARKGTFDWSFLESPDEPQMARARIALTHAVRQVLDSIHAEVDTDYQQRRAENTHGQKALSPSPKREKPETRDEIYDLRKKAREEARLAVVQPVENQPLKEQTNQINKAIVLPEQSELNKLLSSLGSVDKEAVLKAINDFNERGVGTFKMKRAVGPAGERLYTLEDRAIRILVHEGESGEGIRQFDIMDIRNRKDIYRRAGI